MKGETLMSKSFNQRISPDELLSLIHRKQKNCVNQFQNHDIHGIYETFFLRNELDLCNESLGIHIKNSLALSTLEISINIPKGSIFRVCVIDAGFQFIVQPREVTKTQHWIKESGCHKNSVSEFVKLDSVYGLTLGLPYPFGYGKDLAYKPTYVIELGYYAPESIFIQFMTEERWDFIQRVSGD